MEENRSNTYINDVFGNKEIALSNALIQAREKTSLLESKTEFLAIYKLCNEQKKLHKKIDGSGNPYNVHYVTIRASEIKELAKKSGNSLYDDIRHIAGALGLKRYIYEDQFSHKFQSKPLYLDVLYENGKLDIEYNPDTEYLFLELKKDYSTYNLGMMFKFETLGGFGLYKLFKTYMSELPEPDLSLNQDEQKCLYKEFELTELRMQLGYVDLNQKEIRNELLKNNPNLEEIENLEKKPKYKRYDDFKKRILIPGQKEIEELSDIYISDIEEIRGAHNKIEIVRFKIQHNIEYYKKHASTKNKSVKRKTESSRQYSEDFIDDFIDKMREFTSSELSTKELKTIAKVADYDIDNIKKKWNLLKQQKTTINDMVAWLIKAIENNYSEPKKQEPKVDAKTKANSFNNFNQREYNYEELEKALK